MREILVRRCTNAPSSQHTRKDTKLPSPYAVAFYSSSHRAGCWFHQLHSTRQLVFGLQHMRTTWTVDTTRIPAMSPSPDVLVWVSTSSTRQRRLPLFKSNFKPVDRLESPTITSSSIWRAMSMVSDR
jgi:hypothetical protein